MHYLSIKYTQEVTNLAFWEKDKYLTITTAPSTHYTIIKAGSMMATSVVSEELGLIYKAMPLSMTLQRQNLTNKLSGTVFGKIDL